MRVGLCVYIKFKYVFLPSIAYKLGTHNMQRVPASINSLSHGAYVTPLVLRFRLTASYEYRINCSLARASRPSFGSIRLFIGKVFDGIFDLMRAVRVGCAMNND